MGNRIDKKRSSLLGYIYSFPMGLWLIVFFVVPICIIVTYSFLKKGLYGGVTNHFSLSAYGQIFNPSFLLLTWRTIWISVLSTAICLFLAIPCGYAMARSKHQTLLLAMVIIPFWKNSLRRIYAGINIRSTEGFRNNLLRKLSRRDSPLSLIYNHGSVILVLIYMYLPYAILPLFTIIDKFDFSLLDAARDLGAKKFTAFIRILIPNIKSGISTSLIFTFMPIFGAYTVPLLVGGMDSTMLGNVIVDQVQKTRNWPVAAAFSVVLTMLSMIGVLWMMRTSSKDEEQRKSSSHTKEKKEAR